MGRELRVWYPGAVYHVMARGIKVIRLGMDMNQEQLALAMGVSPVTVSRWENGKAAPSLMAQKQRYELCQSNSLDLADYIVSGNESKTDDESCNEWSQNKAA